MLAGRLADASGVPIVREAASTLLQIVDGINCELVAKALNDLFSSFSLDACFEEAKPSHEECKDGINIL
ncbi:MAG: hypothetical protein WA705_31585 [Candidatus Ozemobacteraceae bacterium]